MKNMFKIILCSMLFLFSSIFAVIYGIKEYNLYLDVKECANTPGCMYCIRPFYGYYLFIAIPLFIVAVIILINLIKSRKKAHKIIESK